MISRRIAWCLTVLGLAGLSACQAKPDVSKTLSDSQVLRSHIVSDNPMNIAVAETILTHARQVSRDALCLTGDLKIAVFDAAVPGQHHPGKTVTEDDYPIQIVWPFEPLVLDYETYSSAPIEYLTRPHSPNHVLAHELGHLIFTAHLAKGQAEANGYGSAAPDWLDEAAAILFDQPVKRELRRQFFKQSVMHGYVLSLETLAALERVPPDFRLAMPERHRKDLGAGVGVIYLGTSELAFVPEKSLSLPDYYAQIDTVLLYLEQRGAGGAQCPVRSFAEGVKLTDIVDQADYLAWLADWAVSGPSQMRAVWAE